MQVMLSYRPRASIIERFDPRSRLIFFACYSIALLAIKNVFVLVPLALLPLGLFALSKLTLKEILPLLKTNFTLMVLLTAMNFIGGRSGYDTGLQALRFVGLMFATFTFFLKVNPADYGIMFRQLGLGDKISYALNLMMRFVPTLTRDLLVTQDAQRARGYEINKAKGGILGSLRRVVPIMLPVVVRSVVDSETMANAMELRAFGTQKRTWLRRLRYGAHDFALMATAIAMLVLSLALSWMGV